MNKQLAKEVREKIFRAYPDVSYMQDGNVTLVIEKFDTDSTTCDWYEVARIDGLKEPIADIIASLLTTTTFSYTGEVLHDRP